MVSMIRLVIGPSSRGDKCATAPVKSAVGIRAGRNQSSERRTVAESGKKKPADVDAGDIEKKPEAVHITRPVAAKANASKAAHVTQSVSVKAEADANTKNVGSKKSDPPDQEKKSGPGKTMPTRSSTRLNANIGDIAAGQSLTAGSGGSKLMGSVKRRVSRKSQKHGIKARRPVFVVPLCRAKAKKLGSSTCRPFAKSADGLPQSLALDAAAVAEAAAAAAPTRSESSASCTVNLSPSLTNVLKILRTDSDVPNTSNLFEEDDQNDAGTKSEETTGACANRPSQVITEASSSISLVTPSPYVNPSEEDIFVQPGRSSPESESDDPSKLASGEQKKFASERDEEEDLPKAPAKSTKKSPAEQELDIATDRVMAAQKVGWLLPPVDMAAAAANPQSEESPSSSKMVTADESMNMVQRKSVPRANSTSLPPIFSSSSRNDVSEEDKYANLCNSIAAPPSKSKPPSDAAAMSVDMDSSDDDYDEVVLGQTVHRSQHASAAAARICTNVAASMNMLDELARGNDCDDGCSSSKDHQSIANVSMKRTAPVEGAATSVPIEPSRKEHQPRPPCFTVHLVKPIGISLMQKKGGLYTRVEALKPDGSGQKSGMIRVGDVLAAVGGEDVRTKSLNEVLNEIGKAGSSVNLIFLSKEAMAAKACETDSQAQSSIGAKGAKPNEVKFSASATSNKDTAAKSTAASKASDSSSVDTKKSTSGVDPIRRACSGGTTQKAKAAWNPSPPRPIPAAATASSISANKDTDTGVSVITQDCVLQRSDGSWSAYVLRADQTYGLGPFSKREIASVALGSFQFYIQIESRSTHDALTVEMLDRARKLTMHVMSLADNNNAGRMNWSEMHRLMHWNEMYRRLCIRKSKDDAAAPMGGNEDPLHQWAECQRKLFRNKDPSLTPEKKSLLDEINFDWAYSRDNIGDTQASKEMAAEEGSNSSDSSPDGVEAGAAALPCAPPPPLEHPSLPQPSSPGKQGSDNNTITPSDKGWRCPNCKHENRKGLKGCGSCYKLRPGCERAKRKVQVPVKCRWSLRKPQSLNEDDGPAVNSSVQKLANRTSMSLRSRPAGKNISSHIARAKAFASTSKKSATNGSKRPRGRPPKQSCSIEGCFKKMGVKCKRMCLAHYRESTIDAGENVDDSAANQEKRPASDDRETDPNENDDEVEFVAKDSGAEAERKRPHNALDAPARAHRRCSSRIRERASNGDIETDRNVPSKRPRRYLDSSGRLVERKRRAKEKPQSDSEEDEEDIDEVKRQRSVARVKARMYRIQAKGYMAEMEAHEDDHKQKRRADRRRLEKTKEESSEKDAELDDKERLLEIIKSLLPNEEDVRADKRGNIRSIRELLDDADVRDS